MEHIAIASRWEADRGTHVLAVASLVVAIVWFGASPAYAQPANDTIDGSVPLEVPSIVEQDTTEATTDELDAVLNEQCGAPATDASVWYQVTAEESLAVDVFVGNSSYSAGVIVAAESEEGLFVEACGPEGVFFLASAGVTYQLLIFDDQEDGAGIGGDLVLEVSGEPVGPPPEVDFTIDPVGSFHKDGTATISGTLTCTGDAEFVDIFGNLTQQIGRFAVTGFFGLSGGDEGEENGGTPLTCDGTTQSWSAEVQSENGLFRGGKAILEAEAFACGLFECGDDFVTETIRLRKG